MTISTEYNLQAKPVTAKTPAKASSTKPAVKTNPPKTLGVGDNVETANKPKMPKLTPTVYEIKEGDALQKIANNLGLKLTDLVEQLKDQGKLAKDYDPSAKHQKDIPWMKKGQKINVSYPKTETQKLLYEEFTEARTKDYYNKKAEAKKAEEAAAKEAKSQEAPKGFWSGLFGN